MIARFPDNRDLIAAYSELLEFGIPKSCVTPCFEEAGSETLESDVHCSLLNQLYEWHLRQSAGTESPNAGSHAMPTSPDFRNHGSVVKVNCGTRYMEALEVALKYDAVLVG